MVLRLVSRIFGIFPVLSGALLAGCDVASPRVGTTPPVRLLVPYVGQGAAAVVVLPTSVVAFDAGPDSSMALDALLDAEGLRSIDLLVVSHWDLDHVGGLDPLVARGRVRGILHGSEPAEPWMAARKESWCSKVPEGCRTAGSSEGLSDGFRLQLHGGDTAAPDDNRRGLASRLVDPAGWGLLLAPGDLDTAGESRLLAAGSDLRARVLLVGHHGSRSSSSLPFLGAVRPGVAIVQAGLGNRHGHPHHEALERLRHLVEDLRWVQPETTERLDLGTDP